MTGRLFAIFCVAAGSLLASLLLFVMGLCWAIVFLVSPREHYLLLALASMVASDGLSHLVSYLVRRFDHEFEALDVGHR